MIEDLGCKNQDKFPDEVVEKFVEISNGVLSSVNFVAWNEEEMKTNWRKRPLAEIVTSGEINHLFPCIDAAAFAANYVYQKNNGAEIYKPHILLLTEKQSVDSHRKKESRIIGVDALLELTFGEKQFYLGIGCGDLNLLRRTEEKTDAGEISFYTTRHEEDQSIWRRMPFLRVFAGDLKMNALYASPLELLNTDSNKIVTPCNLTTDDFLTQNEIPGKPNYFKTNTEYSPQDCIKDNKSWTEANKDFLSGLVNFRYR